ncbi:NACHT domain-containing protein [Phytohabitans houttuyneae]|uniref:Uncharacterized protein n=1 Tax=Phytohabitans houttuyneae TaxID=1076126 RepID=A0A6V8KNY4_9ACTN|nr:NACHT domain-containing protein [Phytohabitans houttuyneae]GFJ84081.1 hypothetical protein Phou_082610 [Phytohabitans houttuyneae]
MAGSQYTLEAAREILAGKQSSAVKVLDRLLGVGILAAGPVGVATGQPWLLAAWGWMDQKNELVARLHELVAKGHGKLRNATGGRRYEVLAATHTALVVGSFFASLREVIGPTYAELGLTERDIERMAVEESSLTRFSGIVRAVSQSTLPLPGADGGFEQNLAQRIHPYYQDLAAECLRYFRGLEAWVRRFGEHDGLRPLWTEIAAHAAHRYRAEYLALASDVPEFGIWAQFGEHHAEQSALRRLEELVGGLVSITRGPAAVRAAIAGINRSILDRDIVELDETARLTAVRVPTVADGYVEPHFRWATSGSGARPADEGWWKGQKRETDLGHFLAAHFASPEAACRPLVILGHPGAGKSLFAKVCAARLAATDAFVTVRVPLRDVPDPSASVYRQIADVLQESTHGKVEWAGLCEASKQLVRVVLIDGLDELMQATGATESQYLRNVVDFQRTEAASTGPVAVVVTSRTVVADLATIPPGCIIVKLEEFTDEQIDTWVDRWSAANATAVASGEVKRVEAASLREYGDLARQPLLLLLLAIVAAERELPSSETSADLYRLLLDDFIRRELVRPDRGSDHLTYAERRISELWKLGLVAFGMLNRGQQHLHEQDLAADLAALPPPTPPMESRGRDVGRNLEPARRVVGRFFFVHTAEAEAGAGGRSYEFLHATFGDYLIAHHTVELLRDAAAVRRLRTTSQQWDDDLLFALLSHALLVAFGSRAIQFFGELVGNDEEVAAVLEHITVLAHERWGKGRCAAYDPSALSAASRLAAYTANAVSLRLSMATIPVPLHRLCPKGANLHEWWPRQVRLWTAVLPMAQWGPLVSSIRREGQLAQF